MLAYRCGEIQYWGKRVCCLFSTVKFMFKLIMAYHRKYRGKLQGTLTGTLLQHGLSARPTTCCVHLPLAYALSSEDHVTRTPPFLLLAPNYISFLSVLFILLFGFFFLFVNRPFPNNIFFFSILIYVHVVFDAISAARNSRWRAGASSCILLSQELHASPNLTIR